MLGGVFLAGTYIGWKNIKNTHHTESTLVVESVVTIGRLVSLPSPAARSDSSIV